MLGSLLLTSAFASADLGSKPYPAVELFAKACIDGQLTPVSGKYVQVERRKLPPVVRRQYTTPNFSFFEFSQPLKAIVAVKTSTKRNDYWGAYCAVWSPGLELREAHDQIWEIIWGTRPKRSDIGKPILYEFSNFKEGYKFGATQHSSGWVLLRIGHVGPGQQRAFRAEAERAQRVKPRPN